MCKRLNVIVEDNEYVKFKKKCMERDVSMSDMVRTLLRHFTAGELVVRRKKRKNGEVING